LSLQDNYTALMRELEGYRKSDPYLYLQGLALPGDITSHERRFVRAELLQALALKLHGAARICDFPYDIVVRPQGIFVSVDGLLWDATRFSGNLKASGPAEPTQAARMCEILARMQIVPATIVDVGANFGEITLALARTYPHARIVAIEASSDNMATLQTNRAAQIFSTSHVELVQVAVADKSGTVEFTRGVGRMTHIARPGDKGEMETVPCERLDTLFDRHGIATADFVKIDIEGSEPKLKDALVALGGRVRAYMIEFSRFAPFEDYIALAAALLAQGYACHNENATQRLASIDDIAAHLRTTLAASTMSVANLWFFAPR
jgi:FkbM family methyltransferase